MSQGSFGSGSRQLGAGWANLRWPGLWAPAVAVVAYLAGSLLYGALGVALFRAAHGPAASLPLSDILAWANAAGVLTLGLVSLAFIVARNRPDGLRSVLRAGLRLESHDGLLVVILFAVAVPASLVISLLFLSGGMSVDPEITSVLLTPASMVGAVLVAPVGEELWARGLVYGALSPWGPWVAVIGAGLVSAALHWDPVRIAGVLPIMLGLSWLRWRTGRLAPCVVLHGAYNLFLVGLGVLARLVTG